MNTSPGETSIIDSTITSTTQVTGFIQKTATVQQSTISYNTISPGVCSSNSFLINEQTLFVNETCILINEP